MKKAISLVLILALALAAEVANADFTFGEPTNLGPPVNSSAVDADAEISADGLILFFCSSRSGGYGDGDIWVTKRATKEDNWGPPVNLGPKVNSSYEECDPGVSTDGLSLFFSSSRPGGYGDWDIWVTKRTTTQDDWGEPVNLGPAVNSPQSDEDPSPSTDGVSLSFSSNRSGGHGTYDIWKSTRETMGVDWGEPVNLGPSVNTSYYDFSPSISLDGLTLFFCRGPSYWVTDIWMTRRNTEDDAWGEPVDLGPTVNSLAGVGDPEISADGLWLFFNSPRPNGYGSWDIYQAPIIPIVDLNGDGIVDAEDMCIIVDHWRESYSLCDIGPMPWGDGIVDVQDLIVLAEHLFEEEVYDPALVAHWALDETEGNIAYDSAGICDGRLLGAPVWQPTGGMVDGALQLDGVDDFIFTSSIPSSIKESFSVLAWVKGGAPGQVVISQTDGVNWLCTDTLEGNLMTELNVSGSDGIELLSQTVITDGDWHRLGLVWDGSHRTLYVDGVTAAEDTQDDLEVSENRLFIGTGKDRKSGSYWSGLIDDVRIYNRAVRP